MPAPSTTSSKAPAVRAFTKEGLFDGELGQRKCLDVGGQTYLFREGPLKILNLEEEWFEDVPDPVAVVKALAKASPKPDILSFWQRLPDTEPKYSYLMEIESVAACPITNYDEWWNKQVKGTTRNMVRKSQKAGVEVRETQFDDDFVRGMVEIFNETPVRQGRPFCHYGKNFETVKQQFSRYIFREDCIGAYLNGQMVGFVILGNAGKYGVLGQFISRVEHRDKAINNAMIAKTVEVCVRKQYPFLTYGLWAETSLADFKRHSGFQEYKLPRYYVPLTVKGKIALKLGAHRGWREAIPESVKAPLKRVRKFWFGLKKESPAPAPAKP